MTGLLDVRGDPSDFYSAVGGALFGSLAALLLSHMFLEITLSPFFAGCISLLLLAISLLSIHRAFAVDAVPPPALAACGDDEEGDALSDLTAGGGGGPTSGGPQAVMYESRLRARKTLFALAALCCVGAVSSLLLPRCRGAPWLLRVPLYCLLGNALFLVLALAVADGLQLYLDSATSSSSSGGSGKRERWRVLAAAGSSSVSEEAALPLRLLLCCSLTISAAFGFAFSSFDAGDLTSRIQLVRYRYVCVPLAVLLCALLAVVLNRAQGAPSGPSQGDLPAGAPNHARPAWAQAQRSYSQQAQQQQQQQQQTAADSNQLRARSSLCLLFYPCWLYDMKNNFSIRVLLECTFTASTASRNASECVCCLFSPIFDVNGYKEA
ncbi:hypothetical protein Efla_005049 [Eimeria flavescens]